MSKKNYKLNEGMYFFNIKTGIQNITISRETKAEAVNTFLFYKKVGKDCEWLGIWNGKKFLETTPPR